MITDLTSHTGTLTYPSSGSVVTTLGTTPAVAAPGTLGWTNPNNINQPDKSSYANSSAVTTLPAGTKWLVANFPNLNIPLTATITGLLCNCSYQANSVYTGHFNPSVGILLPNGITEVQVPGSLDMSYGWNTNFGPALTDYSALNPYIIPSQINGMKLFYGAILAHIGDTTQCFYMNVQVTWEYNGGTYITESVSLPSGGSWTTVNSVVTPASGATINYDVLNSAGTVRLSNQQMPIDISGLTDSALKIRANFSSISTLSTLLKSIQFNMLNTV
jgi:hypothetical protein